MRRNAGRVFLCLYVLFMFGAVPALSQTIASVFGIVTDESGAAVGAQKSRKPHRSGLTESGGSVTQRIVQAITCYARLPCFTTKSTHCTHGLGERGTFS